MISGALHGALLAILLIGFTGAQQFDDAAESIPVETITDSQLNEIMKGERDAKPAPKPVEKPQEAALPPVETPNTEPPPALKHIDDPGEDLTPTPPPKPVEAAKPPPAPEVKAAAPPPPLPPPRDAEIDRPEPPKVEPKPEPRPPAPPARPKIVEAQKEPAPEKPKVDNLAKVIEKTRSIELAKPPSKPKSGEATVDPQHPAYDAAGIAKMLARSRPTAAPQRLASLTPMGSPTQNAARMSPSLSAALDGWLKDAYLRCWTPPPTMPPGDIYLSRIQISYNVDGSLAARPVLLNPPGDPAWRAYAESAMRAVQKCDPLQVPPQYAPYFQQWKSKTVSFDPHSALE